VKTHYTVALAMVAGFGLGESRSRAFTLRPRHPSTP
jgi:hypothetical protein